MLHELLTAGTFVNSYSNVGRMLEFAAAALESIPGVAACRFVVPGPKEDGASVRTDKNNHAEYAVLLEAGGGSYGQVVLELHDREQFRKFEAAAHNFLGSLAMRLENINYQRHLEDCVKEQTAKLDAGRRFLQSILDNTGDIMFVIDSSFTVVEANTAALELVKGNGVPGGGLLGRKCHSALYGHDSACADCPTVATMQSGEPRSRTLAYPDGKGSMRWFDVSAFPIRNEQGTVMNVIESWRNIEELKQLQDKLQQAVTDKELLLREIHHRVKNSLNSVVGLLQLQFAAFESRQVQDAVAASIDRIQSTALVHEFLYKSEALDSLDFRAFVERVVQELTRTYNNTGQVEFSTSIQDLSVAMNHAVPISLIVTEVITNALKYAFPDGRPGHIWVSTRKVDPETAMLEVRDNGVGLPESFDLATTNSLGMQLVQALTMQVDGAMELNGTNGTCFQLRFPLNLA